MSGKKLSELSEADFIELLNGFFETKEKRTKLTHHEIMDLAELFNEKVNIPIISETKEEKILYKVILKIDTFLYDHLPNEFYDLVRATEEGIDDDEANRLKVRLSSLANEKIDIPYLPEFAEYLMIKYVISWVLDSARKNWGPQKALEVAKSDLKDESQENFETFRSEEQDVFVAEMKQMIQRSSRRKGMSRREQRNRDE
jgi:hypothetical protein